MTRFDLRPVDNSMQNFGMSNCAYAGGALTAPALIKCRLQIPEPAKETLDWP